MNAKALLAAGLTATIFLAACSPNPEDDGRIQVAASFYPLEFLVNEIGQDKVTLIALTPEGGEPHDLELAPAQARHISSADLVVYQSGFQSAVDKAIEERAPEHVVDAGIYATLPLTDEHEHEGETDEEHAEHGETDPHFWLNTTRYSQAAQDVADALADVDPDNADTYLANANSLITTLTALDEEYAARLSTCTHDSVVVTHAAFGYLAEKYDFHQIAISGIDPEAEPSPARVREVKAAIDDLGLPMVFFETLVSPKVAETLASDLGITTGVLDPIEGLTSDDDTYLTIMADNLDALTTGMECTQ